jgi:hypothetical protein
VGKAPPMGALADRHDHRQGLKGGECCWRQKLHASSPKANVVIAPRPGWLEVQQSKLKLVGWRIALTVIFFFFKATIRFLD